MGEQLNKLGHSHTTEYLRSNKKKWTMVHATIWINLQRIMLSGKKFFKVVPFI